MRDIDDLGQYKSPSIACYQFLIPTIESIWLISRQLIGLNKLINSSKFLISHQIIYYYYYIFLIRNVS